MAAFRIVPSPRRRRATGVALASGLMALAVSTLVGCQRVAAPVRPEPRVEAPSALLADAVQTVRRDALHLLVVPLLDDEQPSRWAVRTAAEPCLDGGEAIVDGEAIDEGTALPTAFTVERRFDACRLFADDRLEVTGRVVMQVGFDDEHLLRATVDARELRIRAPDGMEVAVGDVFVAGERLAHPSTALAGVPDRHLAVGVAGGSMR